MNSHTGIAVLESRWAKRSNLSVRGLFELIADINCGNPHAYGYEMVNSVSAIKEAIPRLARDRKLKILYVASHGNDDGIALFNDEVLSRTELRNLLKRVKETSGSTLDGIYMSSCLFGTQELADFVFKKEVGVSWICGYSESVNWLDSSALDLLFFNTLLSLRPSRKGKRYTTVQTIQRVAKEISRKAPKLAEELGFGIYVRKQHTGGSKSLLPLPGPG